ncbi:MAG: response regulator transcription factor [Caldilineaceae bacterium]|nr:response regulator transcription factor [Caldilineaceae bacterium]
MPQHAPTHPLASVQHRTDAEVEIMHLLERIISLAEAQPTTQSVSHRSGHCQDQAFGRDGRAEEPAQVVLQIVAKSATYMLVKCPSGPERTTLSPREQEIVHLVSSGHPNKSIARKLAISQHTVNTHVRRIFDKLGVSSRAEMVAYALQSGLMSPEMRYN